MENRYVQQPKQNYAANVGKLQYSLSGNTKLRIVRRTGFSEDKENKKRRPRYPREATRTCKENEST